MATFHIHFNLEDPRNAGTLLLQNERNYPPCISLIDSPLDPYMHLGSHPEIVERLWDQIGPTLPLDCRCIVFGTPALVAPKSGILLAMGYGTQYIVRLPEKAIAEAIQAGAKTVMKWSSKHITDIQRDYGRDWIFGHWLNKELEWCLAVYKSVEDAAEKSQA